MSDPTNEKSLRDMSLLRIVDDNINDHILKLLNRRIDLIRELRMVNDQLTDLHTLKLVRGRDEVNSTAGER